jgi:phospholipid/cholesterol/gamma-HCH transport system permease protein
VTAHPNTLPAGAGEGDEIPSPSAPAWRFDRDGEDAVLRLSGDWLALETGLRSDAELRQIECMAQDVAMVRIDASRVGRWDSALVALLARLSALAAAGRFRAELDLASLPDPLHRLLGLARADNGPPSQDVPEPRISVLERTETLAITTCKQLVIISELRGAVALSIPAVLTNRLRARRVDILLLTQECGFGALGIVAIVNLLVGAILGFVGAVQLRRFGGDIYIANLVGIAVVREMAPIMTAIVMAGRTGGAYAAQIATMQGNEEVDALQALGIPVDQFLVVPRVIAAITMTPVLYVYGFFMGLLGGLVVSTAMLGLSPTLFLEHLRPALAWTEFAIGLAKSLCFGTFIALAGCRAELDAGRSAADVGRAATGAVVDGIIGIIALDAVFAACAEVMRI